MELKRSPIQLKNKIKSVKECSNKLTSCFGCRWRRSSGVQGNLAEPQLHSGSSLLQQWKKKRKKSFRPSSRFLGCILSFLRLPFTSPPSLISLSVAVKVAQGERHRVLMLHVPPHTHTHTLLFCCFDPALSEQFLNNRPASYPGCFFTEASCKMNGGWRRG